MDNEIYKVSRDEYAGVVGEINLSRAHFSTYQDEAWVYGEIVGSDGKHLTTRMVNKETQEEEYYVFNLPCDVDRQPPKKVRKITLESREEVEEFFKILNQIQNGETKDGGTVC